MKNSQGHDVAFLHCKQHQHLHSTYAPLMFFWNLFLSLSTLCKQRNEHCRDRAIHTGSKSRTQTCKTKLIKGPLWWKKVCFPLTLHTACLHKNHQSVNWALKQNKISAFLSGAGSQMEKWLDGKNAAEFRENFPWHSYIFLKSLSIFLYISSQQTFTVSAAYSLTV